MFFNEDDFIDEIIEERQKRNIHKMKNMDQRDPNYDFSFEEIPESFYQNLLPEVEKIINNWLINTDSNYDEEICSYDIISEIDFFYKKEMGLRGFCLEKKRN